MIVGIVSLYRYTLAAVFFFVMTEYKSTRLEEHWSNIETAYMCDQLL